MDSVQPISSALDTLQEQLGENKGLREEVMKCAAVLESLKTVAAQLNNQETNEVID